MRKIVSVSPPPRPDPDRASEDGPPRPLDARVYFAWMLSGSGPLSRRRSDRRSGASRSSRTIPGVPLNGAPSAAPDLHSREEPVMNCLADIRSVGGHQQQKSITSRAYPYQGGPIRCPNDTMTRCHCCSVLATRHGAGALEQAFHPRAQAWFARLVGAWNDAGRKRVPDAQQTRGRATGNRGSA